MDLFLNFDRVICKCNGSLEERIWIKFGIQEGTGGCKGPGGKNCKETLMLHASLFIQWSTFTSCMCF